MGWGLDASALGNEAPGFSPGRFTSRYRLSTLLEPDRNGKTPFDRGRMLDASLAWQVSPAGMSDCLRALIEADLLPDPEAEREARVEALTEKLDALLEARLEYAETHKDAGDAYAHLPREGSWDYHNGDQRLSGWMRRVGIDPQGLEIEEISDMVLDNFRMEPGTILDPTHNDDDLFLVDSFPVGEIEVQIDLSKIDPNATQAEWEEAKSAASAHFKGDRAYLSSDRVWYALIDRPILEGLIAEAAAEPDPCP